MEYTSRKQRQKELRSKKEEKEIERDSFEEQIFKEQKKRLRRQLNSVSTFAIDANDISSDKATLKTRGEIKKQKKIDEILKDIAVLPDNEYLNEDTNLRILKKMSVAKQYDKLLLSPEQEKKMAENREKFTNITNQLLFLIQELEKNKIDEPEIGEVPTVSSKAINLNQRKQMFDIELAKTAEQEIVKEEVNTDLEDSIEEIERKLEQTTIKNNELEDVLQKLEAVVAEGKRIAHDEIANTKAEQTLGQAPEDTLELLDFLQRFEKIKNGDSIDLTNAEENVESTSQNEEMKLNLEALVMEAKKEFSQVELADQKRYGDTTTINATNDEQVLALLQKQATTNQTETQQTAASEVMEKQPTVEEEKANSSDTVNKIETQESPANTVQPAEQGAKQEARQEPSINNDEKDQELESVKIEDPIPASEQPKPVEAETSSVVVEDAIEIEQPQVAEMTAPITEKIVNTTNNNETKVVEKKETDFLGKSIIVLGVFFIFLLIAFIVFVVYMLQIGAIEF